MSNTYTARRAIATPAYLDPNWDQVWRANNAQFDAINAIGDGGVAATEQPSASLNVKIAACTFKSSSGAKVTYAGVSSQAMTPSTTNYLYLDDSGTLHVNTTGFPSAGTFHVPIATVVAGTTTITTINDGQVHLMSCGGDVLMPPGTASSVAAGTGAGTSPTVSVTGTAHAGLLSVTTGTSPAVSAVVATVTFAAAFPAAPRAVLLMPANAAAAALTGGAAIFVSSLLAASFAVSVGSTGLAASTAYQWYFVVLG